MSSPDEPNVAPFAKQVHNDQRVNQTIGLDQNTIGGLRGKFIESILQLVVQAITGVFLPGGLGSAFTQLQQWAQGLADQIGDIVASIPVIGPILEWLASLLGIDIGDVGNPSVDFGDIWANVVSVFINPLGFFANLVGGLIPGLQIPNFDASKIVSGFFNNGIIPGLTSLIDDIFGGFTGLFGTGWTNGDAAGAIQAQAQIAAANAAAIAALEAKVNKNNDVVSPIDDFERAPAGNLGPNWSQRLLVGGGAWMTDGHNAYWAVGGNGRTISINQYIGSDGKYSISDYQLVGVVLEGAPQGSDFFFEESYNTVMCRMNDAKNTYVTAIFGPTTARIFAVVNDVATQIGPTVGMAQPATGTGLFLAAGKIDDTTANGPWTYQAIVNNSPVLTVVDTGHVSRMGADYRGWGFGARVGQRNITQSWAGPVRAWAANDPQPTTPVVPTTGLSLNASGTDPDVYVIGSGAGSSLVVNSTDPDIYDVVSSGGSKLATTSDPDVYTIV